MSFVLTLLALGFVIFIHELGHLLAAKKARVGVSEFAVGMGPKIISMRIGETMYSIRALPFGGFIKAKGLDVLEDCPIEEDFREKSVWRRASILAAGSFMNLLLGFVIFVFIAWIAGDQKLTSQVHHVVPEYPAQQSGLLVGDIITHINSYPISDVQHDLIQVVQASKGADLALTFLRNGRSQTVTMAAQRSDQGKYVIGVSFQSEHLKVGFFKAVSAGLDRTFFTIGQSFQGLAMLLSGSANVKELAGPVGIIQIASSQIQNSLVAFFGLIAFISISLGVINLFPFPVLDGGHLMFLFIESVRGKPLNKNAEILINNIAATILIGLMIFIVFNDIMSWDDRVNLIREMNQ
jgi:regulator of sigma E protease